MESRVGLDAMPGSTLFIIEERNFREIGKNSQSAPTRSSRETVICGNLPVLTPRPGSTGLKGNPFAVSEAEFVHQCKPALPNGIGTIQPDTAQGELQTLVSASSNRDVIYEGWAVEP